MQATPSASLVVFDPAFGDAERLALAGFLAGYRGATRDAYSLGARRVPGCRPEARQVAREASTASADLRGCLAPRPMMTSCLSCFEGDGSRAGGHQLRAGRVPPLPAWGPQAW